MEVKTIELNKVFSHKSKYLRRQICLFIQEDNHVINKTLDSNRDICKNTC